MNFFVLKWPATLGQPSTDYHSIHPINTGPAPRCPSCGQFVGMLHWLPPYRVELEATGNKFGDIAFGGGGDLLVSERFKDLYKKAQLTGLEGFDPVEIVQVKKEKKHVGKVPNYYHVRAVISRAAIDEKASEIVYEEPWTCSECRIGGIEKHKRIVIEQGSWSGEDVFYARGLPGTILVSSRFIEFCNANNIEGAVLIPASECHYDMNDFSWLNNYP